MVSSNLIKLKKSFSLFGLITLLFFLAACQQQGIVDEKLTNPTIKVPQAEKLDSIENNNLVFQGGGVAVPNRYSANKLSPVSDCALEKIDSVTDGDTVKIKNQWVRLIGIDAPEIDYKKGVYEWFALEAKTFLEDQLAGQQVCLKTEQYGQDKDKYGRLLRYLYLADGLFLNRELVRLGYVRAYPNFPFSYGDEFEALQKIAQDDKLGLWNVSLQEKVQEKAGDNLVEGISEGDYLAVIPVTAALEFVGKVKTVELTVQSTYDSGRIILLNSEKLYENSANFMVVIPAEARLSFSQAKIYPPQYYRGKTIRVTGPLELYKGKPQMKVTGPGEIEVVK